MVYRTAFGIGRIFGFATETASGVKIRHLFSESLSKKTKICCGYS